MVIDALALILLLSVFTMPSRKTPDGEFKDIVHPLNTETREMIKEIVLKAFEEAKNAADAE